MALFRIYFRSTGDVVGGTRWVITPVEQLHLNMQLMVVEGEQ